MRGLLIVVWFLPLVLFSRSLDSGIIGHYPFDNDAGDISGYNHNGIVHNAVLTTDRFGNQNSAYEFNGINSYIEIPDDIYSGSITELSISLWFFSYIDQSGNYEIAYFGSRTGECAIGIDNLNPELSIKLNNQVWYNANSRSCVGIWQHLVGIFKKGVSAELFINSRKMSSVPLPDESLNTTHPAVTHCNFGSYNNGEDAFFKGKIDDVRIYNRILSQDEIEQLYYFPSKPPEFCHIAFISLPDTVAAVGTQNFILPLSMRFETALNDYSSVTGYHCTIELNYDVLGMQSSGALNTRLEANKRIIEISDVVEFRNNAGAVFNIPCNILKGYNQINELRILDFTFDNKAINPVLYNGSLRLNSCAFDVSNIHSANVSKLNASPNPFGKSAEISFELANETSVNISITDVYGNTSVILYTQKLEQGKHNISFGEFVKSTGVYFIRFQTPEGMNLLKVVAVH